MSLLPNDDRIARRVLPESAVHQLTLKADERFHRDPRCAEFHAGANDRVQHPIGQHRDDAGRRLDESETAGGARLAPLHPDATAMQRVPAVMDVNILPDMGRMDGRWLWAEKRGCSAAPIAAGSERRSCTA
ncbi:hypothetical protein GAY29_14320 [Azospirillum brasilense]|nr:hypothetical protein [Azospirillum brasilense]